MGLRSKHNEATALVRQMTLQEKASLCSGKSFWYIKGNERLGLQPVMVTDGPHGLRKQTSSGDHVGLHTSVPATCFPTASALASSWNPQLLREIGVALGEQCVAENVAVLLGPGVNIKRHPLCGRNFEYFSEDPLLAGEMAAALIEGVQSQGVGTSIKHFAANNQEFGRMFIDVVVDERTLREIYLPAFEVAVKRAQPWTVMCAYNRINGTYCGEHDWLLNQVLREEWGFEGLVVSDWGATNDRVDGVRSGLDLEMPASGPDNDNKVANAVASGTLDEATLDTTAIRVASLSLLGADNVQNTVALDQVAHHTLARRAAAECAVLLKNADDLLPITKTTSFCVIGAFAKQPRYQGTGSSQVVPTTLDNAYDAIATLTGRTDIAYAPGYHPKSDALDADSIDTAARLAAEHDVALVFAGLPTIYESEGFDREHMRMPEQHNLLIEAVCRANPRTVVILSNGAPVEMPWIDQPAAVLEMYLAGQGGGGAAADLIFGDANPCGRLAETFPLRVQDVGSNPWFPGGDGRQVHYREGLYVGYRYFDTFNVPVLFPFGHGLSYTTYEYDDIDVSPTWSADREPLSVRVSVTNSGERKGSETVQVYVRSPAGAAYRPVHVLAGFTRLPLQPGEIGEAIVTLEPRAFACYDAEAQRWVTLPGEYEVCVGASSRDIRQTAVVQVRSEDAVSRTLRGPSMEGGQLQVDDAVFADMLGHAIPPPESTQPFHRNSTLNEIAAVRIGRIFKDFAMRAYLKQLGGLSDPTLARMFEEMARTMPLRALPLLAGGGGGKKGISNAHIDALLNLVNGRFLKGLWQLLRVQLHR